MPGFSTATDWGYTAPPSPHIVCSTEGEEGTRRTLGATQAVADCPDCGPGLHVFDTNGNGVLISRCRGCGLQVQVPTHRATEQEGEWASVMVEGGEPA